MAGKVVSRETYDIKLEINSPSNTDETHGRQKTVLVNQAIEAAKAAIESLGGVPKTVLLGNNISQSEVETFSRAFVSSDATVPSNQIHILFDQDLLKGICKIRLG